MSTAIDEESTVETVAPPVPRNFQELLDDLGGVPAFRIALSPPPGLAAEADVIAMEVHHKRLFELVDGTLVEKGMGYRESMLALILGRLLLDFIVPRKLGLMTGADGFYRLFPGLIRIPDLAYASWDRIPGRKVPVEPIPELIPELAVEVLSESNTKKEMERKRKEYLESGVRLIWLVDPKRRVVAVIKSDGSKTVLDSTKTLDGGDVLPGFTLDLRELFAELDAEG